MNFPDTQILHTLCSQLSWFPHCLRLVQTFPDDQILSTLRRELTWSHLKSLIYIDEPLKRDFYIEICRLERWSVRQLQERINSLLFERTAISKKPEDTP